MLDKHLDLSDHWIVFGIGKKDKLKAPILQKYKTKTLYLHNPLHWWSILKLLFSSRWIYLHYLAYDPTLFGWWLARPLLQKTTWIIWGNDVYSYYKKDKNIKTRIYEWLRTAIIPQFPEIAAFVKDDFHLVEQLYHAKAEYLPILYPIPVNVAQLDAVENSKIKLKENKDELLPEVDKSTHRTKTPVVLVGNSGDETNFHPEAFDKLKKYATPSLRVICPLSYGGSTDYLARVMETGKAYFGDGFQPLTTMMNPEQYAEVLATTDIALMNHNRQQGLGNILALLYLGKKVYLRSSVTSYPFLKDKGCDIFDIGALPEASHEELLQPVAHPEKNKERVKEIIDEKNCLHLWVELFKRHS